MSTTKETRSRELPDASSRVRQAVERIRRNGNGNGHSNGNGNGHSNGNGNGHSNGNGNGHSNGNGNGHGESVRTAAADAGAAILAAVSAHTAEHSDDVVVISEALCEELSIDGSDRSDLLTAARLHDIGKTAIPVEVLDKNGPLDEDEWKLMKDHTVQGEQILASVPEMAVVGKYVRHSHERWDGGGYPDGLEGEDIPLASRVIFCADAFHAIRCDRPYRDGRSAGEALAEVRDNSGAQFDPTVVEALVTVTRKLKLVPTGARVGRPSRLAALLMIVGVGATGSAVAEMGVLDGALPGGGSSAPSEITCGSTDCATIIGAPLAEKLGVGPDGAQKPGEARNAADRSQGAAPGEGPNGSTDSGAQQSSPGDTSPGESGAGTSSNSDASNGGGDGEQHAHPQGGPPGQTGNHPQGGPPGQTGRHPQGGPPGQTGQHPQGGPPGQTGQFPQGGPPGQLPNVQVPSVNVPGVGNLFPGQGKKP